MERPDPLENRRLTRGRVLTWLGGLGLAALIPGCADDGEGGGSAGGTTSTATETARPDTTAATGGATPDCVLTPELTEGPYYLDLDLVRRDIAEGRRGLPYRLQVAVVDAEACEPVEGAAVDVWHCDADGVYSGVQGDDGTFCRGVQITGADGVATFETVFPGWYSGRAVHIHLKVIQGGQTWTGQLFFDDATQRAVYAREPYSARGEADVSNSADGLYAESEGSTIVTTDVSRDRASGRVTVGVQRA